MVKIRNKEYAAQQLKGQVTLEFTFCFIIVLLLLYGCIMAFRWAGLSFAGIRQEHESSLTTGINESWTFYKEGPYKQVNPDFYEPLKMNLIFNNW